MALVPFLTSGASEPSSEPHSYGVTAVILYATLHRRDTTTTTTKQPPSLAYRVTDVMEAQHQTHRRCVRLYHPPSSAPTAPPSCDPGGPCCHADSIFPLHAFIRRHEYAATHAPGPTRTPRAGFAVSLLTVPPVLTWSVFDATPLPDGMQFRARDGCAAAVSGRLSILPFAGLTVCALPPFKASQSRIAMNIICRYAPPSP